MDSFGMGGLVGISEGKGIEELVNSKARQSLEKMSLNGEEWEEAMVGLALGLGFM